MMKAGKDCLRAAGDEKATAAVATMLHGDAGQPPSMFHNDSSHPEEGVAAGKCGCGCPGCPAGNQSRVSMAG